MFATFENTSFQEVQQQQQHVPTVYLSGEKSDGNQLSIIPNIDPMMVFQNLVPGTIWYLARPGRSGTWHDQIWYLARSDNYLID
jgi:hypothetical protein